MRLAAGGECRDVLATEHAFLPGEMPGCADHARRGGRTGVFGTDRADFVISHRTVHVPDRQVPVCLVEHGLAVGFTLG